jgi:histidinol-phosphate phosphatase family protein
VKPQPARALRPAVFLDKDGTLVEDIPYNVAPARLRLTPGARDGLRLLGARGYPLIVVSNQAGIARGLVREEEVRALRAYLLHEADLGLTDFYYCPHDPLGRVPDYAVACGCRKPAPGLVLRACADHGIDPRRSWLVGDILDDVEAGARAGCRTILLNNGHETEWRRAPLREPDFLAATVLQAAELIAAGRAPAPAAETP